MHLDRLQVSAVRYSQASKRNKTVAECAREETEAETDDREKKVQPTCTATRLYIGKFLAMSFRASLTRPLANVMASDARLGYGRRTARLIRSLESVG
jgi:hypothetical protein